MVKKYDVITVGSAVRDVMFFTDKGKMFKTPEDITSQKMWAFEYGAKINVDACSNELGGGAFNTAYNFQKLGFKVAPMVCLGKDIDGQWVRENIQSHGISDEFIQYTTKAPTGLSLVLGSRKKGQDHIIFVNRGANEHISPDKKIFQKLECQWIFISSLHGKDWVKTMDIIFQAAKEKHIKIAWNPGSSQLALGKKKLEKYLSQTSVLLVNKDEAIELALSGIKLGKRDPKFLNKPVFLLNILNDWGPKTVVITLGKKGAVALKEGKFYNKKVINKKVVDTTGVGDAFGGAFIAGLMHEGEDINKALLWGIINSSYVVTKEGAHNGVLTKNELLSIAKKMYG